MAAGKKRQLNYELLRIIAMLMIVSLHYLSKGGLLGDPARADMTLAGYTAWFVEALCLVAVNVYVLISGYFGVNARGSMSYGNRATFTEVLKKPFQIWKQVLFYSMLFGCGALVIGVQEFDLYQFFSYCFPIVTEHYWFATYYIVLCLLMPFLNIGISYLEQKESLYLLTGLLLVFSVSKTVIPMQLPWDKYGYDSMWFIVLYLTGAYLRRYGSALIRTRLRAAVLYFGSIVAVFASFVLIRLIYLKTGSLEAMIHYGYAYNFLFCYTGAVGLFLLFAEYKKAENKDQKKNPGMLLERFRRPIELVSGATFGVYLIHEHINIRYAWPAWFHCEAQAGRSTIRFLGHMLVTVLCVYLICTAIELVRQKSSMTLLPALILLVYPLRHAGVGLDMMDAGYALGNYRFFESLNPMWKLATYLANVTGVLLSKLPFGDTWTGMNVYCGLLIGAVAAGVYLFLWNRYGQKRKLFAVLFFVSEMAALSLCWAPPVILYHYLGYLLMTAAVMVLFVAIIKEKRSHFVIAGVILGLCVAVRMPNITYMALILPVWCDCFWNRDKKEAEAKKRLKGGASKNRGPKEFSSKKSTCFCQLVTHTLYCIGGYFIGLFIPLGVICARYGMTAYSQMISSLFGMTEQATDYKPTAMVSAMFGDYIQYSVWLLLFAGYMAIGVLFFFILDRMLDKMPGRFAKTAAKEKITIVAKLLYIAGLLVVLRFCYGRGMFDFNYSESFSMYKWVTVYLLIVIGLCICMLLNKTASRDIKLWAVFLLVIIFITPLGSNNWLYPIINNLFLVMPVSILMITDVFHKLRQSCKSESAGAIGAAVRFPFQTVLGFVLICTALQSVLFGAKFVFHDAGALAYVNEKSGCLELRDSPGTGLVTTADKNADLEELGRFLYPNALNKRQVILYGNIPAVAYLFDMEPAIFTTWADLDSNSMDILKAELEALTDAGTPDTLPVIILGRPAVEGLTGADGLKYQKLELLLDFIERNGYRLCFENAAYLVLTVNPNLAIF